MSAAVVDLFRYRDAEVRVADELRDWLATRPAVPPSKAPG